MLYEVITVNHSVVEEIKPGHCVPGLGVLRLLLHRYRAGVGVEFDHPVAFRIPNRITEYIAALRQAGGLFQKFGQPVPVKDVVPQNKSHGISANEGLSNQKGLREALGLWLGFIGEGETDLRAVSKQLTKQA